MVLPLIINLEEINVNQILMSKDKIREVNPHRYEMEQLDGILKIDRKQKIIVGFKDIKPDEFWVKGHFPARPLFPGVLMIESAAQLSALYMKLELGPADQRLIGFGGVDDVKFRNTVVPGDKLIIMAKCIELRSRRAVFETQGVVNGKIVFEATITGMPV